MNTTSRQLFKDTLDAEPTRRPPCWVMRQAGRFLPEYRALKQKYTFTEIVKNPELATEATLQPIRRFGFDCAIVFSDILVVSEALGFPYHFKDAGGIRLEKTVETEADIAEIEALADTCAERLSYVAQALKNLRRELPDKALLGFCAAPWTLACYMVQGESAEGFPKLFALKNSRADLFERLMNALAAASKSYIELQTKEGIDGFQIFDSHAGLIAEGEYFRTSGKYNAELAAQARRGNAAAILFANSMSRRFAEVAQAYADFYSLDGAVKLSQIQNAYNVGVQGNLPPETLTFATPDETARQTREILQDAAPLRRHIFNLAHGIRPDAKLENVEAMCKTVFEFDYEKL